MEPKEPKRGDKAEHKDLNKRRRAGSQPKHVRPNRDGRRTLQNKTGSRLKAVPLNQKCRWWFDTEIVGKVGKPGKWRQEVRSNNVNRSRWCNQVGTRPKAYSSHGLTKAEAEPLKLLNNEKLMGCVCVLKQQQLVKKVLRTCQIWGG